MKTETQAECHTRLKCKPDEELEECKKRLRAAQARDGGAGQPGDADKQGGDRNDADKDRGDRGDRDDADKKGRDRDRDRDRDADKKGRDRDRDRGNRRRGHEGGRVDNDRGRGGGRNRDDGDAGHGGGGDGGHGVLRRGTHPGFFSGGFGPSWGVCYRGNCGPTNVDYAAFYGTLDFGWHFSGSFKGPAIGANIHGGYGSFGPFNDGRFGAGFKFWWDIPMANDLGLYFTPFAQAGWSSFIFGRRFGCDPRFFDCGHDWEHFFNLQFGAMLRMVLGNRGLVYFQPMTFDNVFNGGGYGLLYHFEIGGGVIFGG